MRAQQLKSDRAADDARAAEDDANLGRFDCNPSGISLRALLREDFETHGRDPLSQGFWAVAVHRVGNWRMGRSPALRKPLSMLYKIAYKLVQWLCGIELAYTVKVGRRVRLLHSGGMVLGALEIEDDVHIRQNVTFGVRRHGDPRWQKPVIGRGCQIGAGAVIVGAIRVGEYSMVGANVVLAQSVPHHSVVTAQKPDIRSSL